MKAVDLSVFFNASHKLLFWTQEEFALKIGISQNYLSSMEHGKFQIGAEILLRISSEFGKSIERLLIVEE